MNTGLIFRGVARSMLLGALMGSALTAQAQGRDNGSAASRNSHCVAHVEPVAAGQKTSVTAEMGCFATFAAAMHVATDGAVSLPAGATPDSISQSAIVPNATTVIGVDYDARGFGGASRVWRAGNRFGCLGGRFYYPNMPAFFNNRLSSTRNFGGCGRNWSFDLTNQRGDYFVCFGRCSYVGSFMDNRASSKLFAQ